MSKCYRTPNLLLMTAHAINMGLFRQEGVLQGVTTKNDWQKLGYEVISGDFSQTSEKYYKLLIRRAWQQVRLLALEKITLDLKVRTK